MNFNVGLGNDPCPNVQKKFYVTLKTNTDSYFNVEYSEMQQANPAALTIQALENAMFLKQATNDVAVSSGSDSGLLLQHLGFSHQVNEMAKMWHEKIVEWLDNNAFNFVVVCVNADNDETQFKTETECAKWLFPTRMAEDDSQVAHAIISKELKDHFALPLPRNNIKMAAYFQVTRLLQHQCIGLVGGPGSHTAEVIWGLWSHALPKTKAIMSEELIPDMDDALSDDASNEHSNIDVVIFLSNQRFWPGQWASGQWASSGHLDIDTEFFGTTIVSPANTLHSRDYGIGSGSKSFDRIG